MLIINQRYIADLHFNFNKQRFNLTQTQHRYWIQFNSKFHLVSMHNIHYTESRRYVISYTLNRVVDDVDTDMSICDKLYL
jgi:hypothetical protein